MTADVDRIVSAARVNARVAVALIRCAGMQTENLERQTTGAALAYTEDDFLAVIDEEAIGHNAVVSETYP